MPLQKGFLLNNRYRIEGTIASGGMGAIYRAFDETLGIDVAVKENFFSTDEFSRQFRREATILAGLRHPNLPRVTDHFVITGTGQYLVMDFIEGLDLRDIIARHGAISKDDVVRIGVTICDALAYLHGRSPAIVHRDIKPGNLKITPSGQVILVDFGLAKLSHGEATTVGAQALTPGYAPPEQYGQGTEPRSDLYSLGATLYAALTGKIPEDGLSRLMGSNDLTPIRTYNPQSPLQLAQVIEHSMMVHLDKRYQTAEAFRQALMYAAPDVDFQRPIQYFEPTQPRQPLPPAVVPDKSVLVQVNTQRISEPAPVSKPVPQLPPQKKKTNFMPVIIGVVFFALLAGTAGLLALPGLLKSINNSNPTTVSGEVAILPSETSASEVIVEPSTIPTEALLPTASLAPTKEALTVVDSTAAPTPTEVQVAALTNTPEPQTTPVGGGLGQIAFASQRDGVVQVWISDLNGSESQVTRLSDGACQPAWSPDGKRLVFISPCSGKKEDYAGSSLYLINADGTGLVPLSSLPGGDFDPAWSPDGNQIAFTTIRDNGVPHIYLYTLADNTVKRLSRVVNYERQAAWSPDGKTLAYQTTRLGQPQIWTMTADGENAGEFSSLAGSFEWMPVWAPDRSILVYSQGSPSQLVARIVDDRQAKEFPLSEKVRPAEGADFSPDGWWVVFESKQADNVDIYYMSKNGSNLTRLTDNPGLDFQPAWRPPVKP